MVNDIRDLNTLNCRSDITTLTTKVSDILSVESIISMPENSSLFLTVGTGGGKTYFATHNLYRAAQELDAQILIFENRINTRTQMEIEIDHAHTEDRTTVISYQSYEKMIADKQIFDFSIYDIIVLDEYQHISIDSILPQSYYTYNVVEDIMKHPCRRLFMSATPRGLDKHIQSLHDNTIPYWSLNIPMDYSHVYLQGFNWDGDVSSIIESTLSAREKGLFFLSSAQKARNYHDSYKDSMYVCSMHNTFVPMDSIDITLRDQMLNDDSTLPRSLLFTTTSMDVGVSLHDPNITTVTSDLLDIEQNIQCLGRRRFDMDDTITFYLLNHPLDRIYKELISARQRFEKCLWLYDYGIESFFRHYNGAIHTEKDSIMVDCDDMQLKPVMGRVLYAINYIETLEDILDSGLTYVEYVRNQYGFNFKSKLTLKNFRTELLEANDGRVFFSAKERGEFIKELHFTDSSKSHTVKSVKRVNEYLKQYQLPYQFIDLPRKKIDGKDFKHMSKLVHT